jgi:heat shock protein HslJ
VLVLAVVGVLAGLAACGSDDEDGTTTTTEPSTGATEPALVETELTPEALAGRTFLSQEVEGYELVPDSTITIGFEGTDVLGANAGCNQMSSSYELDGATLRWTGVPAATMMACPDELMAQDTWLTELLTAGMEATLDGTTLTLVGDGVTIVLLDEQEASPDQPIVGTAWTLDSIIANEAVSSVPADVGPPTLTIAEDGATEVYAGCNRGGTAATIADDGSTITFGPIATTKMACEPAASEVEAAVLAVLDGEVDASVDGDQLTLTKGDAGLVYRAG